jgi:hypothetical protein
MELAQGKLFTEIERAELARHSDDFEKNTSFSVRVAACQNYQTKLQWFYVPVFPNRAYAVRAKGSHRGTVKSNFFYLYRILTCLFYLYVLFV